MQEDLIIQKLIELDVYVRQRVATKDELRDLRDEVVSHVDEFTKLHETLDHEVVSLRSKIDRLEARFVRLEERRPPAVGR